MGLRLNLDYALALASRIGVLAGVEERQLRAQLPKINAAHASLVGAGDDGWPHLRCLAEPPLDLVKAWAEARRQAGERIVVVGEPGALAAARALMSTAPPAGEAPIPPISWVDGLDAVDPLDADPLGGDRPVHVLALDGPGWVETVVRDLMPGASGLTVAGERDDHGLGDAERLKGPVDARFGVFGPAALALAALAGVDVDAAMADGLDTARRCSAPGLYNNPAYLWAALLHASRERGIERLQFLVPSARLVPWADWAARAWLSLTSRAETRGGVRVHVGWGATVSRVGDEAMLQHVVDGPRDVMIVALNVERGGALSDAAQRRWSLGRELMSAAVQQLSREGRPVVQIRAPSVGAPSVAALSALTLHTALTVAMLQDIDPLATPAVAFWRALVNTELQSHP